MPRKGHICSPGANVRKCYFKSPDLSGNSYNTWIEFHRKSEKVVISIVKAEKEQGSRDIEFNLRETIAGEWAD